MRLYIGSILLVVLSPFSESNNGYADTPVAYPSADGAGELVSLENELSQLHQRMRQYEREMELLRQQVGQPANPNPDPLSLTSHPSPAKSAGDGEVELEQVDIQTKPNHKMRGRLFFDHVMFADDPDLGLNRLNETGFDSARIGVYGNIVENVKYAIEIEFEGTEVDFKSTYIEAMYLPVVGNFRAGYFYEPIAGLEENSGSRYQEFMEGSIAIAAFIPGRSFGYMAHRTVLDEDLYFAAGTFRHLSDDSPTRRGTILGDAGDWVYTGRVAWNPYYDEPSGGRYLIHLGFGYSYRTDPTGVAFNTISELGNQAGYLATTVPGDEDFSILTPELLLIWNRLSIQSEGSYVPTGGADFWGMYVEASFFLTSGHRGYRRSDKTVAAPVIDEPFFTVRSPDGFVFGKGGLELKARWSHVNLRSGVGADRGLQDNWSCGFNWYLNRYTRVMFDYVYEDVSMRTGVSGNNHNLGTRLQVHW